MGLAGKESKKGRDHVTGETVQRKETGMKRRGWDANRGNACIVCNGKSEKSAEDYSKQKKEHGDGNHQENPDTVSGRKGRWGNPNRKTTRKKRN